MLANAPRNRQIDGVRWPRTWYLNWHYGAEWRDRVGGMDTAGPRVSGGFTGRACARDRYLRRRITASLRDAIEESMLHGEQRQLDAARDAQLVEYPGEVVLHGLFAEGES